MNDKLYYALFGIELVLLAIANFTKIRFEKASKTIAILCLLFALFITVFTFIKKN